MGFLSFGQDKTADSLGGLATMKRGIFQADALPVKKHSCVTNPLLEYKTKLKAKDLKQNPTN